MSDCTCGKMADFHREGCPVGIEQTRWAAVSKPEPVLQPISERALILVAALNAIADPSNPDSTSMCECEHDDENCCVEADYYCPQCIASVALLKFGKWKVTAPEPVPPEQWILEAAKEGQIMGVTNLTEGIQRHYAPVAAAHAQRIEKLIDGVVEHQKHRDAWRGYAYGTRDKPQDFLAGNMVDRPLTFLEINAINLDAAEVALTAAKARIEELDAALDLANIDFNHLRTCTHPPYPPLNNRGRWMGEARGEYSLQYDFRGDKACTKRKVKPSTFAAKEEAVQRLCEVVRELDKVFVDWDVLPTATLEPNCALRWLRWKPPGRGSRWQSFRESGRRSYMRTAPLIELASGYPSNTTRSR